MFASTGAPAVCSDEWTNWSLLFATQPEPDLEFTEEDLDETLPPPTPPMKAPKRSGKRPFLWILLLLLVGGIGYVAMDPDGVMQLIEPYLAGEPESHQPAAQRPHVPAQAPAVAPPGMPGAASPVPTDAPAPSSPVPAPPAATVTGPLFSEGQRVTVISDPNRPKSPMPLFVDSAGTRTSLTVPANATLTILDGDYQNDGWVYAVRTEDGRKGWIPERLVKLTR
jgi:hypothetical protein